MRDGVQSGLICSWISSIALCYDRDNEFSVSVGNFVSIRYTKYVSGKAQLYLDNRLYASKRATCLALCKGHFQSHILLKSNIELNTV